MALIGGIALVAFGVIFFRLWYLQVLSGDQYEAKANDNRVREIKVQAPRGEVVDRDGRVLVDNRTGLAVKVTPGKLPDDKAERLEVYKRLAGVLGSSAGRIDRSVSDQLKALPYSAATVKQDVKPNVVAYLLERQKEFPGVTVERVFLRQYPHKQIGAHLFGTVGEITKEQLKDQRYRGVGLGDRVGQSGIEYQYDRFLRGKNGASRVQVDALGSLKGELSVRRPVQGRQLRLSVDLGVQKRGPGGAGRSQGRLRGHERAQRPDGGAGLHALVRPQPVLEDHPPARLQAPVLRRAGQAAVQPGDPGRLSHRLDLQAGHLGGRPRGRASSRPTPSSTTAARSPWAGCGSRTPATSPTARWRCARRSRCRATSTTT